MKKAFSLVEFLSIFAVVAILIGIGTLSYMRSLPSHYALTNWALILSSDIRGLQLSSIHEQDYSKLYIDFFSLKRYILVYPSGKKLERVLPEGIRVASSNFGGVGYLSFSPSGAPLQGGYISLTDGEEKLYVIVAVATGRVRISKKPP